MGKLSGTTTATKPTRNASAGKSPVKAKKEKTVTNLDGGGTGTDLKAKSELFLAAISTFAGERTFYESGQERIDRIVALVHKVTKKDADWVERFVAWLRGPEVNIRTISLIIAAEYVYAGGPNGRKVIDSVCQRADEPAEILAWWMQNHYGWDGATYPLPSPKLPQALRKGLGDAIRRLYTQYNAIKYNGLSRGVSMAHVLNLVHPRPEGFEQAEVFQFIIDRAYGNDLGDLSGLELVSKNFALRKLSSKEFASQLTAETAREAGLTWEQVGGMLPNGWTAEAWESLIPSMGYMALLRNLNNFEQAGISAKARKKVVERLSDPEQVARSRQLPFRFYSAFKFVPSAKYHGAIGEALELSVQNVPTFTGRTLILVDKSGSMSTPVSDNSGVHMWEIGALFGMALHNSQHHGDVDIAIFGDRSKKIVIPKGTDILHGIKALEPNNGVGHGTNIWGSMLKEYDGHDRVVVFTDIQDNWNGGGYGWGASERYSDRRFSDIPFIHYFDLRGYGTGGKDLNKKGRYQYGGFSDSTFKMMGLLETADTGWPF